MRTKRILALLAGLLLLSGSAVAASPLQDLLDEVMPSPEVHEPERGGEDENKDDDKKGGKDDDDRRDAGSDAPAFAPIPKIPDAPSGVAGLVLPGVAGLLLLGAALVMGRVAARPPRERLKGGPAGRAAALASPPEDVKAALASLESAGFGRVLESWVEGERAGVALKRKRSVACSEVEGYLVALFESAWGRDVEVEHTECAGKKKGRCAFEVQARPSTSSAPPGAGS